MKKLDCISVLKALSEVSRVKIINLLVNETLGVNEIANRLKMTQYNVSKQLRVLREAGLVEIQKQGQRHLYSIPEYFKSASQEKEKILKLKCCEFRLDELLNHLR